MARSKLKTERVLSADDFEVRLHDGEDRMTLSFEGNRVAVFTRRSLTRLRDLLTQALDEQTP